MTAAKPLTMAVPTTILTPPAVAAALVPAVRASTVNPTDALRAR